MRTDSVRLAILLGFCVLQADGFVIQPPSSRSPTTSTTTSTTATIHRTRQRVLKAGFGSDANNKKKKEVKIKPKQQWDRYTGDLKKEKPYRVGIKAEGKNSDEWLEVGNVKSKGGEYTKMAVARQRALIAEHARRLFPLQVSPKDKIEWAYWDASGEDWIIVDKGILDEGAPDGLEKLIGFEGRPDPASGYYCVYNEGKLVSSDEDLKNSVGRSSKKLQ